MYHDAKNTQNTISSQASTPLQGDFSPSVQLQIRAIGYNLNTACSAPLHEQITVHSPDDGALKYTSVRPKRKSNSCALVYGANTDGTPCISTIYRWGPGRPPKMRIFPKDSGTTVEAAIESNDELCEVVEVSNRRLFSRTQVLKTSFGNYEWRFGSRQECEEAFGANSLLIMEKIDSTGSLNLSKKRIRIAQLVRNDEYRSEGTNKNHGGNGGRLMMDLRNWADEKTRTASDMEEFIVAGCICMLKREADRMIDNAIAAIT